MEKNRKKPADINVADYMKTDMSGGKEVPIMPNDCVAVYAKLLPEVHKKLKALSKVERVYQMAIINAAMIEFLEKKEKELGLDLAKLGDAKTRISRPMNGDVRKVLETAKKG